MRYNIPMKLRWCIRGFAIALLTLCLSLWAWSYFRHLSIEYKLFSGQTCWVNLHKGGFAFGFENYFGRLPPPSFRDWLSWDWTFHYAREACSLPFKNFLGFVCRMRASNKSWWVAIPFWFSSLLSAGLLWFVWRQTREKIAWRGFPVEMTQNK